MVTNVMTTKTANILSVINPAISSIRTGTISCQPRVFIVKPMARGSFFQNLPGRAPVYPPDNLPAVGINKINTIRNKSKFSVKLTLKPMDTKKQSKNKN